MTIKPSKSVTDKVRLMSDKVLELSSNEVNHQLKVLWDDAMKAVELREAIRIEANRRDIELPKESQS